MVFRWLIKRREDITPTEKSVEGRVNGYFVKPKTKEQKLFNMRRKAITHCVSVRGYMVKGQEMAVSVYLRSICDDKNEVDREFSYYRRVRGKMMDRYGINVTD